MENSTASVARHYTQGGMVERVLARLVEAGLDPDNLDAEELYSFDQLHGRGLAATREHIARAGITPEMHVLDIGCGVGGTARYLAASIGCRVTAIDLTQEYIDIARDLTTRCGLSEKIEFHQANALGLPFADGIFDHVMSQNVTMNIADKIGFATETARVLKPGGRFSCSEVGLGPAGDPNFPVTWARDPADSFLVTPAEMRAALEAGGYRVLEQIDETAARAASGDGVARPADDAPPDPLAGGWLFGEDWRERRATSGRNAAEGRTVSQFIIAQKPGSSDQ